MSNYSRIHPDSSHQAHLIDLFLFKGAPVNRDEDHPVEILINHGYVVGFAPTRLQPLWSAYRVAHATRTTDFDRPHLYYADERLEDSVRLDNRTFGKKDDIAYHVGHMVPNEVINVQFGRLAQMETFFMSNMCPQRGTLNTGAWLRLENAIRNIEDMPKQRDHVWAIVGPIFDSNPQTIERSDGKEVPIPESFFCITIDPFRYPWDKPGNQNIACFRLPQDAPSDTALTDFLVDLDEIEQATNLTFMPGWASQAPSTEIAAEAAAAPMGPHRHRLITSIENSMDV